MAGKCCRLYALNTQPIF